MLQDAWSLLFTKSDFFLELFGQHMTISLIAIALSSVIGIVLGILISEYQKASKLTLSIVNLLYTIPSLALLGLLIPFTGASSTTAIIALTAYGLLPMVKNTHTGITGIDPVVLEAAEGMGATRMQLLLRIKLPLALPVIMSGFRNMVTMTISLTSIAAYIGAGGLGTAIFRGISTNNMAMVIDGSILTALLAIVVDLLLGVLEKRMYRVKGQGGKRLKRGIIVGIVAIVIVALVGNGVANRSTTETITVAGKYYTEQIIISDALAQYIEEETDYDVELTNGISGGTTTIEPAMENGDYDLTVEYTGSAWSAILQRDEVYQETMFDELQSAYNERGLTWTYPLGFNNTYGLAVTTELAEEYGLETYSDLAALSKSMDLTFIAEPEFYERPDGYDGLCNLYDFRFANTKDVDSGLKYQTMAEGDGDVVVIFTTDGKLSSSDLVVLEDDETFFPSYQAYILARTDLLEEHPDLEGVLAEFEGVLDETKMSEYNDRVDSGGEDPSDVASDLLADTGLVEE